MSLSRKVLVLLGAVLLLQLGLTAVLSLFQASAWSSLRRLENGRQASTTLMGVVTALLELRRAASKFQSDEAESEVADAKLHLKELLLDFGDQPERAELVKDAIDILRGADAPLASFRNMVERGYTPKAGRAIWKTVSASAQSVLFDVHELTEFVQRDQAQMQATVKQQQEAMHQIVGVLYGGIALELLLITATIGWFRKDVSRRMKVILANTIRLADGVSLLSPVAGHDEIAQLDAVFHTLANAVTESAQIERDLLDKQLDVICSVDERLRFQKVNQACETVFGYPPQSLSGKEISRLIFPDDLAVTLQNFESSKASVSAPFEARVRRADGKVLEMLWTVRWSRSGRSFFCIAHDIAELKQVERLRQEVMQMVSHDIRSPLTTVFTFLDLFETPVLGNLSPEGERLVAAAVSDTKRMSMMINDLLDMEKLEAGMMETRPEKHSLQSILDAAVEETEPMFRQDGVRLDVMPSNTSLTVDKELIVKALAKLLLYAMERSTKNGSVRISSSVAAGFVELDVADSGTRIAEREAVDLFSRFRPIDEPDGNERAETNFSLALCRALIELNRGTISLKSSDGTHTCFCVCLPVSYMERDT